MKISEIKKFPQVYKRLQKNFTARYLFFAFSFLHSAFLLVGMWVVFSEALTFISVIYIIFALLLTAVYFYAIFAIINSFKKLDPEIIAMVDCALAESLVFDAAPYKMVLTKNFLVLYSALPFKVLPISCLEKLEINSLDLYKGGRTYYLLARNKNPKLNYMQAVSPISQKRWKALETLVEKTNQAIADIME